MLLTQCQLIFVKGENECTFSPMVTFLPANALPPGPEELWAGLLDPEEAARRLSVEDTARRESDRANAAAAAHSQFTFQPSINAKSRRLAEVLPTVPLILVALGAQIISLKASAEGNNFLQRTIERLWITSYMPGNILPNAVYLASTGL